MKTHRTILLNIDGEDERDEDDEDDRGVEVRAHEGRLEAAGHRVRDHEDRDEEASRVDVHAGQSVNGSSASEDEHGGHDDIRHEAENKEHLVGGRSPPHEDELVEQPPAPRARQTVDRPWTRTPRSTQTQV